MDEMRLPMPNLKTWWFACLTALATPWPDIHGQPVTPSTCVLGTFERAADINDRWRPQYGSRLEISRDHATHGRSSCKVICPATPGGHWRASGLRKTLLENDWRPYEELHLDVYNASSTAQKLFLEFRDAKGRSELASVLPPQKRSHIALSLTDVASQAVGGGRLDLSGIVLFSLYLSCPKSEVILFVDDVRLTSGREGPVRVPEIDQAATALRGDLAQLAPLLEALPDKRARGVLAGQHATFEAKANGALADAAKPSPSADDIQRILTAFDSLRTEFGVLHTSICRDKLFSTIKVRSGDAAYGLAVETSLKKVFRDYRRFDSPLGDVAEISLCRNEHEACQAVVIPTRGDLTGVYAEVSDLLCVESGARIDRANIECFKVGYVKTTKPRYRVDYVGWWPDPLLDDAVFDVAKDDILQPIWIDVYAPPATEAGTYEGRIEIRSTATEPRTVKLRVHVWAFELPMEHHLKTAFSFSEGAYWQFYFRDYDRNRTVLPQRIRRRIYAWLLEHRVSPTNIYRTYDCCPIPHYDDLEFCIERGLDSFNIGRLQRSAAYGKYLREHAARLREKGWLKYAYIYGPDEIQYRTNYAELKEEVKRVCKFVREIIPGAPVVGAIDIDPDLRGHINVWCPLTTRCDFKLARECQAAGDQVWWYWCAGGRHPGLYLDFPAIDPRIVFWLAWRHRIDGFLYYTINGWGGNLRRPPAERWPIAEWDPRPGFNRNAAINGSGMLVYPGRKFGELLSSIRFENIRDGLEDYEYLWLLNERVTAQAATKPNSRFVREGQELLELTGTAQDFQTYTRRPAQLLAHRARVARLIEEASRPRQ